MKYRTYGDAAGRLQRARGNLGAAAAFRLRIHPPPGRVHPARHALTFTRPYVHT